MLHWLKNMARKDLLTRHMKEKEQNGNKDSELVRK